MKHLLLLLLTIFALSANAQTAEVTATETATFNSTNEETTVDVLISLPMMGNITINNCDKGMEIDVQAVTYMKVVNKSDTRYIFTEEPQQELATTFDNKENAIYP